MIARLEGITPLRILAIIVRLEGITPLRILAIIVLSAVLGGAAVYFGYRAGATAESVTAWSTLALAGVTAALEFHTW